MAKKATRLSTRVPEGRVPEGRVPQGRVREGPESTKISDGKRAVGNEILRDLPANERNLLSSKLEPVTMKKRE